MKKDVPNAFEKNLQTHYPFFVEQSVILFEEMALDASLRVATRGISSLNSSIDFSSGKKLILESVKYKECIVFNNEVETPRSWHSNNIKFPFFNLLPPSPSWGSTEFWKQRAIANEMELECERQFWTRDEFEKLFKSIDQIFYTGNTPIIHFVKGKLQQRKRDWENYVQKLIATFFEDFKYSDSLSTKRIIVFTRALTNKFSEVLLYDKSGLSNELSDHIVKLPSCLQLKIIETDRLSSLNKPISNQLNIGLYDNPFFSPPCYTVQGYLSVIQSNYEKTSGVPFFQDLENYYELARRHAFFFMYLLSKTSSVYTTYIKSCLAPLV